MSTNCTVCNNPVTNKYCSHCGQLITNKKARTWTLIVDFFGSFFSVDKSFIGTSRKLLSDPKFIVENFLNGNKRYYVSPGGFILYGITVLAIHSLIFKSELWGIEFMAGGIPLQYIILILLLPFLTLCSYLTFIKQGFHLAKHIISISYISTIFLIIFLIVDDLLFYLYKDLQGNLSMLLFFLLTFLGNSFVFSKKGKLSWHILNMIIQLIILIGFIVLIYLLFQSDRPTIE